MKRVYANRFHVLGDADGTNSPDLFSRVVAEVEAWGVDVASRQGAPAITAADLKTPGGYTVPSGFKVQVTTLSGAKAEIVTIRVEHLDADDKLLKWQTIVEVASASGNIEVLVTMFTGFVKPLVSPIRSHGSQPRIVRNLADKFHCSVHGQRLTTKALKVPLSAQDFVEDTLCSPERSVPAVVVTKDRDGQYAVDPDRLASILVGIANVYAVPDTGFSVGLTNILGRNLSVFDGGIRIYWPQFRTTQSPRFHTLYVRYVLTEFAGRALYRVAERLYDLMAGSFVESMTAITAKNLIAAEKMAGAEKARTIPQLQRQLAERDAALEAMKEVVKGLEIQIGQLQDAMWQINILRQGAEPEPERADFLEACAGAKTALDVVELAGELLPGIKVHEHALRTSAGLTSNRLGDLANALHILNQTAMQYKGRGELGKPFRDVALDVAKEENLKFGKLSMNDSETATNQFRDERTIVHGGEKLILESHFTIAKNSDDCLNLYFEPLPLEKKVLVGYVGRHLTNKGNR